MLKVTETKLDAVIVEWLYSVELLFSSSAATYSN